MTGKVPRTGYDLCPFLDVCTVQEQQCLRRSLTPLSPCPLLCTYGERQRERRAGWRRPARKASQRLRPAGRGVALFYVGASGRYMYVHTQHLYLLGNSNVVQVQERSCKYIRGTCSPVANVVGSGQRPFRDLRFSLPPKAQATHQTQTRTRNCGTSHSGVREECSMDLPCLARAPWAQDTRLIAPARGAVPFNQQHELTGQA